MQEISRRTWWLLTALVMSAVVVTVAIYGGQLGFLEPFESVTVRAGAEVVELDVGQAQQEPETQQEEASAADDDETIVDRQDAEHLQAAAESRAVPTLEGEPVHLSWIETIWTSHFVEADPVVEQGEVGDVERRARMLLLVMAVLFLAVAALWTRRYLGEGAAAMTAVVLATTPVFYLGAVYLSGPLLYVGASALSIMAFFHAVYDESGNAKRWIAWAALGGLALAVVALDQRLIGVYATVAVVVGWAISQAISHQDDGGDERGLELLWPGLALLGFLGAMLWGWSASREYEGSLFRPDIAQTLWLVGPPVLLAGLALAARKSPVGRALCGLRGLVYVMGGAIPLVILGSAYASVLPTDPDLVEEGRLALAYLLESQHLADGVEARGDFSWWWRPIGYGFLPYVIFLIPALGFLGWKLRPESDSSPVQRAVATLCLAWPVATFAVIVPATGLGHTTFPAFFPLVLATGWMLSDTDFWRTLRLRPAVYFSICIVAVFMLTILTKDIEEFPPRLVEFVLGGVTEAGLAEDFAYGDALDRWKSLFRLAIILYFVGIVSWLVFLLGDVKRFAGWIVSLVRRLRRKEDPRDDEEGRRVAAAYGERGPGERRMAEREAWRDGDGVLAKVARRLERQFGLVILTAGGGLGLMAVFFGSIVYDVDDRLSSRAVVETYLESAEEGQALWRFEVGESDDGFYVRGLDAVEDRRQFNEKYNSEERFFALIPEERLARINSRVRGDHGENLPILAAGGGMYLVTNELAEGEEDVNPIAPYVLDELDEEYTPLVAYVDGEEQHPQFDRQVEYLGYRLDRDPEGDRAVYRWGETMEITQYFRVVRRVPSSQEIFMHIDFPGHRLHGDHDPVGGIYPTNYWQPGDIIKDVYEVEIDRFSPPGVYTVWMGFYRGNNRMSVWPDTMHDGDDRLQVTTIEVVAF